MSNSLAIAAVTATLRNLIEAGIAPEGGGITVTTRPPDEARNDESSTHLNLFLYQTHISPAWRNADMPRQARAYETGYPPLGLDLYYMVTSYESKDDEARLSGHRLLGRAMLVLHDHPLLGASEIKAALADSDLGDQVERVRITPLPISLEEMSKLWAAFQTEYRISVTYQVSVVLLESSRPTRTPLPVLTRSKDDSGIVVRPNLLPPFPTIEEIQFPNQQSSALLGDSLTIVGHDFDGDSVKVRLTSPRLSALYELPATATSTQVTTTLADDPPNIPAGFYSLAVVVSRTGESDRVSNEYPLLVAPTIVAIDPPVPAAGDVTLEITCKPEALPNQRASLLFGDREVIAEAHSGQTDQLTFAITDVAAGDYFLRLRIDGVDSILIDRAVSPPQFKSSQKVTVT